MNLTSITVALAVVMAALTANAEPPPHGKPQIMIVGTYHFASKANLYGMSVDDPMGAARQEQIKKVVDHLTRFRPTKVVLEQTVGTRDLEQHYRDYLRGSFSLPVSENYQVGFRVAKALGLPAVYTINAFLDLDYDSVDRFARSHGEAALMDSAKAAATSLNAHLERIQEHGSVLDLYRYLNELSTIDLNASIYMYLTRVGDDTDFVGADVVSKWHLRNLEMFAKLTRLVTSPGDRILVLYGQGHEALLKEFARQLRDLSLVDAMTVLR